MNADYLYDLDENEGNFRNVFLKASGKSGLMSGLGASPFMVHIHFRPYRAPLCSLAEVTPLSSATDANPGDQAQKGWAGAVLSHDGNVLAIGDFTFLSAPYASVADNALLISNMADFLLGSPREQTLTDFPFIFGSRTIALLPTSNIQLTAEMTAKLSKVQAEFASAGMSLKVVQQAPSKGDLIVLGTYESSDDLDKYVKLFGVSADAYGAYVKLPPFGKIGQSGNGLLLFRTEEEGNTLVRLQS